MKKIIFFLLIFIFTFSNRLALVQGYDKVNKSQSFAGIETIKTAQATTRKVPKDTQTRKTGSVTIIESFREYVSRKFQEMAARFTKVESKQEELKNELEQLKKAIDELKRNIMSLKEREQLKKASDDSEKREVIPKKEELRQNP